MFSDSSALSAPSQGFLSGQELPQKQSQCHHGASGVNPCQCQKLTACCNRLGLTFQSAAAGPEPLAALESANTADVCSRQACR